ncbi:hypothetical protein AMTR_s00012p00124220 [Amborella trichopoda]|uniref:Uncharacterized protein n=1 Tax=Amborella trichopoda TaxID=13333 RepID=W1PKX2_AMBTC|nr:hypothetical protein AMTR_s00012p00124220 [Amborella trichopoda]
MKTVTDRLALFGRAILVSSRCSRHFFSAVVWDTAFCREKEKLVGGFIECVFFEGV